MEAALDMHGLWPTQAKSVMLGLELVGIVGVKFVKEDRHANCSEGHTQPPMHAHAVQKDTSDSAACQEA